MKSFTEENISIQNVVKREKMDYDDLNLRALNHFSSIHGFMEQLDLWDEWTGDHVEDFASSKVDRCGVTPERIEDLFVVSYKTYRFLLRRPFSGAPGTTKLSKEDQDKLEEFKVGCQLFIEHTRLLANRFLSTVDKKSVEFYFDLLKKQIDLSKFIKKELEDSWLPKEKESLFPDEGRIPTSFLSDEGLNDDDWFGMSADSRFYLVQDKLPIEDDDDAEDVIERVYEWVKSPTE